jgi:hypothetical protein
MKSPEANQIQGEIEISEYFDWMRMEITQGGISLPNEETSVLFTAKALQLASRIQGIYRHLPLGLKNILPKAAIVYQCWELQKNRQQKSKWNHGRARVLRTVNAVSYVGQIGNSGSHHRVVADDGFQYVVTLLGRRWSETLPATEMLCNELARLAGLTVPSSAVVALSPELLTLADANRKTWPLPEPRHSTEFCCGFQYIDSASLGAESDAGTLRIGKAERQQLLAALVFDIWTLNLSPRRRVSVHGPARRQETVLMDHSHCLMGGNWSNFLGASFKTLPAPQGIGARVTKFDDLSSALRRFDSVDLNPLWELAFQMPPAWYGFERRTIAKILFKLDARGWDLRRAVDYFLTNGYFVNAKLVRKPVETSATITDGQRERTG